MDQRLKKACEGKSASQGGLNVPDLKKLPGAKGKTRKELLDSLCKKKAAPKSPKRPNRKSVPKNTMSDKLKKACQGKSAKQGGLNVTDLKKLPGAKGKTRKELLDSLCISESKKGVYKSRTSNVVSKTPIRRKLPRRLAQASPRQIAANATNKLFLKDRDGDHVHKVQIVMKKNSVYPDKIKCDKDIFSFVKKIGEGGVGVVNLYKNQIGQEIVVKSTLKCFGPVGNNFGNLEHNDDYDIYQEMEQTNCKVIKMRLLNYGGPTLKNPNKKNPKHYHHLVMEKYIGDGINYLEMCIKNNDIKSWFMMCEEIRKQLACMRNNGVYFIDLKPANILFNKDSFILADLGSARYFGLRWKRIYNMMTYVTPEYNGTAFRLQDMSKALSSKNVKEGPNRVHDIDMTISFLFGMFVASYSLSFRDMSAQNMDSLFYTGKSDEKDFYDHVKYLVKKYFPILDTRIKNKKNLNIIKKLMEPNLNKRMNFKDVKFDLS